MTKILFNKSGTSVNISQEDQKININTFLKEMYYELELDYPKFFKMDNLCKLGVIGTEFLVRKNINLFKHKLKIGIIIQNKSSSLDSDLRHQKGIENNTVSPAVFVYTLPNIVIGEISIKYKWQSEGVFFVDKEIDYELLSQYSNILINKRRTEINIIGWIELLKDQCSLKLYLIDGHVTALDLEK